MAEQCLVDDAKDIARHNQGHKKRIFSNHHIGSQRFGNRNRPADSKTEQEKHFPNAEMWPLRGRNQSK